jgi:hypothetical protein
VRKQNNLGVSIAVTNQLTNPLVQQDPGVAGAGFDCVSVWDVATAQDLDIPAILEEREVGGPCISDYDVVKRRWVGAHVAQII